LIPHSGILPRAKAKTADRQGTHGDNWKVVSEDSLAYGAMYKIERARVNKDRAKALDDLEDAFNYVAALWERRASG
jgi:hypothetical protein